jgi:hypothetical protein
MQATGHAHVDEVRVDLCKQSSIPVLPRAREGNKNHVTCDRKGIDIDL